MKYLVVFTLCVAAASAFVIPPSLTGVDADKLQEIINAINHPSTDPATAAALEQMLHDMISPIDVTPVIVPPGVNVEDETSPISVGPAIVDESVVSEPANYQRPPLVQVIINVNGKAAGNPVVVEQPFPVEEPVYEPEPIIVAPVVPEEIKPEPIIVAPVVPEEIKPEPVIVAPVVPEEIKPEPVIVAPIVPSPVVNLPGIIN